MVPQGHAQIHKRDPKLRRQAAGAVRRNLKADRDQEKPKPGWLALQKLKGASPWAVGTGEGEVGAASEGTLPGCAGPPLGSSILSSNPHETGLGSPGTPPSLCVLTRAPPPLGRSCQLSSLMPQPQRVVQWEASLKQVCILF